MTPGHDRDVGAVVGRRVRRAVALFFVALAVALAAATAAPDRGVASAPWAEAAEHYDQGRVAAAARIWRDLAEDGNAAAQVALAGLHANGELGNGRPDFAAAVHWYRKAARQGDVTAQINLGDYYARGRGVPRDPVCAWVWLKRAAEQGSAWAGRRAEAVASEMTAVQRATAKARRESATDCRASFPARPSGSPG